MLQVFVSLDEEKLEETELSIGKALLAGLRDKEYMQLDANWNKRVVYDVTFVFGVHEVTATQSWVFT